jgi:hypothetical protein
MTKSDPAEILDRSHDALLRGDLPALRLLAAQLETADLGGLDPTAAERLRRKAERNQHLLAAAARGVRTARARLGEIMAEPALTTYDARGRKASVGQVAAEQPRRF